MVNRGAHARADRARYADGTPGSDTATRPSNDARADYSRSERHTSRIMGGNSDRHGGCRRRRQEDDGGQRAGRQPGETSTRRISNGCSGQVM